ncbi:glycosyltransferase family 2 protein [Actinoplanes sp. HUAS TT8]|uniref:glycosyltransferase family 2 protein n=1 Tax=Actinoplanes sp. HUAS TT8 TaxID=3447453 RepID=UPI003F51CC2A
MSVIIPAGTAALPVLLAALPAVDEVIVVVGRDDDTTRATPRAARVIRQTRTGVGNALACGVAASTGDIVVTVPGDGGCDPAELPRYVRALLDGADVAQGTRFRGDGRDLAGTSRTGVRIVLWLMAVLFGVRRTDPGFGFRAFWRDVAGVAGLPRVSGVEAVRGDGVDIEPLLTVRAALNGLTVAEVPGVARPRTAPASRAGLLEAGRALLGEYFDRRRAARESTADSIVVMTGRHPADELRRTGTDASMINPGVRRQHIPVAPGAATVPLAPAGGERRLGPRRFAGEGRTLGETTTVRRQWRDNPVGDVGAGLRRVQGRPNLRVINGEGGGGSRTGKLRAVPPSDLEQ